MRNPSSQTGYIIPWDITVSVRITTRRWFVVSSRVRKVCNSTVRMALTQGLKKKHLRSELRTSFNFTAIELAVLLTDDATVKALNYRYRSQNKPTNVLSFTDTTIEVPEFLIPGEPLDLGGIAIALQTTLREARKKFIPPLVHLQHLIIHGTLHLLGYDHEKILSAETMEDIEIQTLASLGTVNYLRNHYPTFP